MSLVMAAFMGVPGDAKGLRRPAWEIPVFEVTGADPAADFTDGCVWTSEGWKADSVKVEPGANGVTGRSLLLQAKVDGSGPSRAYFNGRLARKRDWSAYQGIAFNIRAHSSDPKAAITLRLIVNDEALTKITVPPVRSGDERRVTIPFPVGRRGALPEASLLRFFLVGRDYADGTEIRLRLWNFELLRMKEGLARLPDNEAGVELTVGEPESVSIVPFGAGMPRCMARVHTGEKLALLPTDVLALTATELFTDKKTHFEQAVGRELRPGVHDFEISLPALPPGYYWLTCDLMRGGRPLAGGRVGFADFYCKYENESDVHAILSLRTGMGLYITDPAGGYGAGSIALMPTYDPRDARFYLDFIKAYQHWSPEGATTSKDTEVLEAGVAGTVFAAAAFRESGETERALFAEKLLKSNCDYMIDYMQNPDGSTKWDVNEYLDRNLGAYSDTPTDSRAPDTNQVGEWLRALSRAMLHFMKVPGEEAYVERLYKASLKSADFIVRSSTDRIGSRANVIRHFILVDGKYPGGRRKLYEQEGRQCDVYLPRAMAGLSYFAYVRQLREGSVPQSYLDALRDTTEWAMEKMKPDTGWFDWQCGYEVEGGCHAFLGNMYLAEAAQGYYLLAAARGDRAAAKLAADCTKRALDFVTDHDRFTSRSKGPFEFWVGPYLYWQFTEYLGSIGPDAKFRAYLDMLHDGWAERRGWQDFTQRTGKSPLFRANELSNIHQSILAYPALRHMEDIGRPFRYGVPLLRELGE